MQVIAEIAIDRPPEEIVQRFVTPLDEVLKSEQLGRITRQRIDSPLWVEITFAVAVNAGFDRILQFLAENGAPEGSLVYQVGWFGQKKNIVMLGPE